MTSWTFLLILLSIVRFCSGLPPICSSTDVYGRTTGVPVISQISKIPEGFRVYRFSIPEGSNICQNSQRYFKGVEVVVCDYDVPPKVRFAMFRKIPVPYQAIVSRRGLVQEDAVAYTIYYCDIRPGPD